MPLRLHIRSHISITEEKSLNPAGRYLTNLPLDCLPILVRHASIQSHITSVQFLYIDNYEAVTKAAKTLLRADLRFPALRKLCFICLTVDTLGDVIGLIRGHLDTLHELAVLNLTVRYHATLKRDWRHLLEHLLRSVLDISNNSDDQHLTSIKLTTPWQHTPLVGSGTLLGGLLPYGRRTDELAGYAPDGRQMCCHKFLPPPAREQRWRNRSKHRYRRISTSAPPWCDRSQRRYSDASAQGIRAAGGPVAVRQGLQSYLRYLERGETGAWIAKPVSGLWNILRGSRH